MINNSPGDREYWAQHGSPGWYTTPAMEHYICHKAYIPKKRAEIIFNTVEVFPYKISMPNISSTDDAIHVTQDLINLLEKPAPDSPLVTLRNIQNEALRNLTRKFDKATSPSRPTRVVNPEQHQTIIENFPDKMQKPYHSEPPRVPVVEAYP